MILVYDDKMIVVQVRMQLTRFWVNGIKVSRLCDDVPEGCAILLLSLQTNLLKILLNPTILSLFS